MNFNILVTVFVIVFVVGAIGWLWWACIYAPDLTQAEDVAHAAWLEARRKRCEAAEGLDETENGVDSTVGKDCDY